MRAAGVPELYNVVCSPSQEAELLYISKAAFQELLQSFPGQHDSMIRGLLSSYGLTHDGQETHAGGAAVTQKEDGAAKMQRSLKARAPPIARTLAVACSCLVPCGSDNRASPWLHAQRLLLVLEKHNAA